MQANGNFRLTVSFAKERLHNILDEYLGSLASRENTKGMIVEFNDSLLEDWLDILAKIVIVKNQKSVATKPLEKSILNQKKNQRVKKAKPIAPSCAERKLSKGILLGMDLNKISFHSIIKSQGETMQSYQTKVQKVEFQKGYIRQNSSYNFYSEESVCLIGGCRTSNSNLKSPDIMSLNIHTKQLKKIGELPYGVSSHSSLFLNDSIYIVGGNRNHSIVSKKCFVFHPFEKKVQEIGSLNFPSASHSIVSWRQKYIYKFGGVGHCFGNWDLSPYIERYSIENNQWEVINPVLSIPEESLVHYNLLIKSFTYVSNRESIIVLGGVDLSNQGSNHCFQLIVQEEDEAEATDKHQIKDLFQVEGLSAGCFYQQESIIYDNKMFVIQTVQSGNESAERIVQISNKINYL